MKHILFLATLAFSLNTAFASIEQAPPRFNYLNDKVVFIDIESAHYDITYDLLTKTASVESLVTFHTPFEGYPILDLVPDPTSVVVNGLPATSKEIRDPDRKTKFRVLNKKLGVGKHQVSMRHFIETNVVFKRNGVASGFWNSDLNDRKYLEQYLPSNLEYDQMKMTMKVRVIGATETYALKVNGKKKQTAENTFEVEFPEFYNASSIYFHLLPEASLGNTTKFDFISVDGRKIPVDIYTIYDPEEFAVNTLKILNELEADYGPFPHDQVIIYGNMPSGGMEYSGATATSLKALGHELFHCYHARALMPANGNAGWMDEAIARWRDNGYPLVPALNFSSTQLAGRSVWSRMTDRKAYTEGSTFLSWIAYRMNENGTDFKVFLKDYFNEYKFTTVTTELFRAKLVEKSGLPLYDDFERYIYGKSLKRPEFSQTYRREVIKDDPNHPVLTKEQLINLTWP